MERETTWGSLIGQVIQENGKPVKSNQFSAWVSPVGFEPTTASLEGRCSIQLSYEPIVYGGDDEIKQKIVGVAGFEPATSSSQTRRDNRATLHPEIKCANL